MDSNKTEDAALDSLFDAARSDRPEPGADFLARLNADAVAAMPRPVPGKTPRDVSIFSRLKTLFAASGLSGAAALGIWIGFVMPDLVAPFSMVAEDTTGITAFMSDTEFTVLSE